jgi:hypothetical protein
MPGRVEVRVLVGVWVAAVVVVAMVVEAVVGVRPGMTEYTREVWLASILYALFILDLRFSLFPAPQLHNSLSASELFAV